MPTILSVDPEVLEQVTKHNLDKKFTKACQFLQDNPSHPSLHVELLEPKDHGVYSFRLDRKYRGIFLYRHDKQAIEIVAITTHYH